MFFGGRRDNEEPLLDSSVGAVLSRRMSWNKLFMPDKGLMMKSGPSTDGPQLCRSGRVPIQFMGVGTATCVQFATEYRVDRSGCRHVSRCHDRGPWQAALARSRTRRPTTHPVHCGSDNGSMPPSNLGNDGVGGKRLFYYSRLEILRRPCAPIVGSFLIAFWPSATVR